MRYTNFRMRCPDHPMRAIWLALFACISFLSGACQHDAGIKPFDNADGRAERALRELGAGLIDVVSFRTEGRVHQDLPNAFHSVTSIYYVHFIAEVRYARDVQLRSRDEAAARLREADASATEVEREIALRHVFGVGPHAAGSTQVVRASAVFEESESGWRFLEIHPPFTSGS